MSRIILAQVEAGPEHVTPGEVLDLGVNPVTGATPGDPVPTTRVDERLHHAFARFPDARVHLYGKAERPGRKVGHVTVRSGPDEQPDAVRARARLTADYLATGVWPDGWDPHA